MQAAGGGGGGLRCVRERQRRLVSGLSLRAVMMRTAEERSPANSGTPCSAVHVGLLLMRFILGLLPET